MKTYYDRVLCCARLFLSFICILCIPVAAHQGSPVAQVLNPKVVSPTAYSGYADITQIASGTVDIECRGFQGTNLVTDFGNRRLAANVPYQVPGNPPIDILECVIVYSPYPPQIYYARVKVWEPSYQDLPIFCTACEWRLEELGCYLRRDSGDYELVTNWDIASP